MVDISHKVRHWLVQLDDISFASLKGLFDHLVEAELNQIKMYYNTDRFERTVDICALCAGVVPSLHS
jgi:hypothetical protein